MTGGAHPRRPDGAVATISADWLHDPDLAAVFGAIRAAGFEARAVGGAVRDALLAGLPRAENGAAITEPADVDLATTATPDETIAAMEAAGLKTIPTGVQFGTVTVISGALSIEVTTLRRDIETDGRHAVVSYSADWAEDARRRDFTINALYADQDGNVFDPGGGLADLQQRQLRFIGVPEERIREDYLRTVRLYRFAAQLPDFAVYDEALAATVRTRKGLASLSAERVREEVLRLVVGPRVGDSLRLLQRFGLTGHLMPTVPRAATAEALCRIKGSDPPDSMTALAAAFVSSENDVTALSARMKLSRKQERALADIVRAAVGLARDGVALAQMKRIAVRYDIETAIAAAELHAARRAGAGSPADVNAAAADLETLTAALCEWDVPSFPVAGADVIAAGVAPGPRVGEILDQVKAAWERSEFTANKSELLRLIEQATETEAG
ncbi:MAG: CCA tRNA nucleotidyltransferase [Pseudomonadota bacterium]